MCSYYCAITSIIVHRIHETGAKSTARSHAYIRLPHSTAHCRRSERSVYGEKHWILVDSMSCCWSDTKIVERSMLNSGVPCVPSKGKKKLEKMESLLITMKPSKVVLKDIMPKRKFGSAQEKKIESIRRVVQTYNCAHQPVSQYFKRVTSTTTNNDDMFTICEAFHRAVNIGSACFD